MLGQSPITCRPVFRFTVVQRHCCPGRLINCDKHRREKNWTAHFANLHLLRSPYHRPDALVMDRGCSSRQTTKRRPLLRPACSSVTYHVLHGRQKPHGISSILVQALTVQVNKPVTAGKKSPYLRRSWRIIFFAPCAFCAMSRQPLGLIEAGGVAFHSCLHNRHQIPSYCTYVLRTYLAVWWPLSY